jgi:hypothetical protein
VMTFLGAGLGLVGMSWRMLGDPSWRRLGWYVLTCGVTIVLLFIVIGGFAIEDGAPLRAWTGLLQRLVLVVWFPCIVVLATRLLRVPAAPRRSR